jgi:hypothetical protein
VSGPSQKLVPRPKKNERPPYAKYAFLNPYNLSLLAGAGVTAAATGQWWLGVSAVALEAVWMLFAPDSTLLQRVWFDKVWQETKDLERQKRQYQKYSTLPPHEQYRATSLKQQQQQIEHLAAQNPSFTTELLRQDLAKLEGLIDDFLDMAVACSRCEQHLSTFDLDALEREMRRFKGQIEKLPAGDERRTVAQRNLEVLLQRKERYGDLAKNVQTTRGHMDLMENTFRLLADDIVSMTNPAELGDRLDDLRMGFEAVRETSKETERLLQAVRQ